MQLFANRRLCTAAKSSIFNKIATLLMALAAEEDWFFLFHRPVYICRDRSWQWIRRIIRSDFLASSLFEQSLEYSSENGMTP
jgi:hypothetical protein